MAEARRTDDPLFCVTRQVVVTVEMRVSAPDHETAAAVSELVLSDLTIHADCARILSTELARAAPNVRQLTAARSISL
jgi:hypothetical protein